MPRPLAYQSVNPRLFWAKAWQLPPLLPPQPGAQQFGGAAHRGAQVLPVVDRTPLHLARVPTAPHQQRRLFRIRPPTPVAPVPLDAHPLPPVQKPRVAPVPSVLPRQRVPAARAPRPLPRAPLPKSPEPLEKPLTAFANVHGRRHDSGVSTCYGGMAPRSTASSLLSLSPASPLSRANILSTPSRHGAAMPWSAASLAATRKCSRCRPFWRQEATTVSSRSTNRLPASLSDPKPPLRHRTTGCKTRFATSLVGSTPSTRAKVHRAGHHFGSCRHSAAAFPSGLSWPRRSSRASRAWSGTSRPRNCRRSNSPARNRRRVRTVA